MEGKNDSKDKIGKKKMENKMEDEDGDWQVKRGEGGW